MMRIRVRDVDGVRIPSSPRAQPNSWGKTRRKLA